MILYSEGVKYDFLELSRQFHVILHGYQNGDDDETVFACEFAVPKKEHQQKQEEMRVVCLRCSFCLTFPFLVQISSIEQLSID